MWKAYTHFNMFFFYCTLGHCSGHFIMFYLPQGHPGPPVYTDNITLLLLPLGCYYYSTTCKLEFSVRTDMQMFVQESTNQNNNNTTQRFMFTKVNTCHFGTPGNFNGRSFELTHITVLLSPSCQVDFPRSGHVGYPLNPVVSGAGGKSLWTFHQFT